MLIDRSFANIASTRIGDLEGTKSLEKGRKEEYPDSDFFYEFSIEMLHAHCSCVESESTSYECDSYIQGSDDIEKCKHITNTRDIVESELFEKETASNER